MERSAFTELMEKMEQLGKQADQEQAQKVYWSLEGHDEAGNAIIKVYKDTTEYERQIEKAKEKKESLAKGKPKVTLADAERFDRLITQLINEDVTYVVPNRRTGNNVEIDYAVLDGEKKGKRGGGSSRTTTVTKTTTLVITEAGALG